jgi:hypothetical protein
MAIAENCGHDRRGEVTWVRNADGSELVETVDITERRERDGDVQTIQRRRQMKRLADDLPWVAAEYKRLTASSAAG